MHALKFELPFTEEERQNRKKAVEKARASVELEGFTLSPEAEKNAILFINGDIDLTEFVKGVRQESTIGYHEQ